MVKWNPEDIGDTLHGTIADLTYRTRPEKGVDISVRTPEGRMYQVNSPFDHAPLAVGQRIVVAYGPTSTTDTDAPLRFTIYVWGLEDQWEDQWVLIQNDGYKRYTPEELAKKVKRPVEELRP